LYGPEKFEGFNMDLEQTTKILSKYGFDTELRTAPDMEHFGNWVLIAKRAPLALRVINDRGVVLDLMEWDAFQGGANESDWFNWDVVARALGIIQEENGEAQLGSFLRNFYEVEKAFLHPNWATTKDLLHKIEAEKRREFMEGRRVPTHA
jgi:hypothetical protein